MNKSLQIEKLLQIEKAVQLEQVRKRGLPPLLRERGQAPLPDLFCLSFYFLPLLLVLVTCSNIFAQDKPQTFNAQGVSIEFTATPKLVVAGEETTVRFKITGNNGSVPLTN